MTREPAEADVDMTDMTRRHCVPPSSSGQERGDRLNPGRFHSRRQILLRVREALRRAIDSDLTPAGAAVLDYGCGNKPYAPLVTSKFRRYVGADFTGNAHADVTTGPAGELPLDDGRFDLVLSTQVLEHVPDPRTYLREARRVLKPDGRLLISTHGVWPYHPDPEDYWRWTIDGLQVQLCRAGFEILWLQSVFSLTSCAVQLWQDGTLDAIPRWGRPAYVWMLQSAIGLIERRHVDELSHDASIYVLLARRDVDGAGETMEA